MSEENKANWRPAPIDWAVSDAPVDYQAAADFMDRRVQAIAAGEADELIWLLEHPPLYTAGTSARPEDLRAPERFPVFKSPRGGQYTYHGPGQRVVYVMLNLNARAKDVRAYVQDLEACVIDALAAFAIKGERRAGRVGVWVDRTQPAGPFQEDKVAAIGVRIKKWVTLHGLSLNVEPDLEHFAGITPCGISEAGLGVTSLVDLGLPVTLRDADIALKVAFEDRFGPTRPAPAPL